MRGIIYAVGQLAEPAELSIMLMKDLRRAAGFSEMSCKNP